MQGYGAAGDQWRRPGLRQRLGALLVALAIEAALLLLVLAFGGSAVRERVATAAATAITFVDARSPAAPSPAAPAPRARQVAVKSPPPLVRPPTVPLRKTPGEALPFVPMSKADLAAGDIAGLGSAAAPAVAAASGAGAGEGAGSGDGPGGVHLYNAEWVVEPSNAQLRPYLPGSVGSGSWALIACQTIPHNHVENCTHLGEGPRGSGLAKAMRLAAWQFLVRPPRIDGKPMVGSWVRIRIDFDRDKGSE